jgi:hypothetical protein
LRRKKRVYREPAPLKLFSSVVRVVMAEVMMVMVVMVARESWHREQNHRNEQQGQQLFHAPDYSHKILRDSRL